MSDSDEDHLVPEDPGFGVDLTDGRETGDWKTRYPENAAKWGIRLEALGLGVLIAGIPAALLIIWVGTPQKLSGLDHHEYRRACTFAYAWLGGALGGAVFSAKWLYHFVGHGLWHKDRLLWRFFQPLISGGLAFSLIAIVTSGVFAVLDNDVLRQPSTVVGVAFLLGYFSDNTIARLAQLAKQMLGDAFPPST